jgi:hypothetical protein
MTRIGAHACAAHITNVLEAGQGPERRCFMIEVALLRLARWRGKVPAIEFREGNFNPEFVYPDAKEAGISATTSAHRAALYIDAMLEANAPALTANWSERYLIENALRRMVAATPCGLLRLKPSPCSTPSEIPNGSIRQQDDSSSDAR